MVPGGGSARCSLGDEVVAVIGLLEESVATVDILAVIAPGHASSELLATWNKGWRLDNFDPSQALHDLESLVEGRRSAVLARHLDTAVGTERFHTCHAASKGVLRGMHQGQVSVVCML